MYANTLRKNRSLNTMLSDNDIKEETDHDEGDETDLNGTMAFNESIYRDEEEEVFVEALQEKYNFMYTNGTNLLKSTKLCTRNCRMLRSKKESLEQRNYKLVA